MGVSTKEEQKLWWLPIALVVIKAIVFFYDFITLPIFLLLQRPWMKLEKSKQVKAHSMSGNPEGPYVTLQYGPTKPGKFEGINTVYDVFINSVKKHSNKQCIGTREILGEEDEVQPNGKVFKKLNLGQYHWMTFSQVSNQVTDVAKAFTHMGLKSRENIVLFAETRAEWLITAISCFSLNIPVVTLYANLGDEALVHGINETEAEVIITSSELLPKFKAILKDTPQVRQIVYMEGHIPVSTEGYPPLVKIASFSSVVELGKTLSSENLPSPPSKSDTAIIMYTSGSTGVPKGVIITHENLLTPLVAYSEVIAVKDSDVYLAYLPLAHVLELIAEFICIFMGIPLGYSSPLTISDKSTKVKRGCQGDASLIRPTFVASVPLILDRIYKSVNEVVGESSPLAKELFTFFYRYKLSYYKSGFSTPLTDRLIFGKVRNLLGGRVRLMVSGSAPLSPDTQEFIRIVFACPLMQGYALTETCACTCLTTIDDMTVARVGPPMSCVALKLDNWEEGNYRVTDKPYPRGEILIGGVGVVSGYYKNEEKTKEDFFDENGIHWFRSGDIGEIHEDGSVKIIDRKKDLVKLQYGEYVSLGKVESELKTLGVIENVCVYGDSTKLYTVALIMPNPKNLNTVAKEMGWPDESPIESLCADPKINEAIAKMVIQHGLKAKLEKFEIPQKVKLIADIWTPDTGLVTAAFKLRRRNIQDHYQSVIDELYK